MGFSLTISPIYYLAMGFGSTDRFKNGVTEAKYAYSQELYDKIDASERIRLDFIKNVSVSVSMNEPTKKVVSYLISSINLALRSYKISFVYDGSNMEFNSTQPGHMCKLSHLLCTIFAIPLDTIFHGTKQI